MDVSSTRSSEHAHIGLESASLPAPPTDRELVILRRLLGALREEGATQLLEQLRMLQVDPSSDETTRIYVLHHDVPRSTCSPAARAKVNSASVRSPEGRVTGEVALWVDHGHLRALQFIPHDPRVALTLPDPGSIAVGDDPEVLPTTAIVHGARGAIAGVQVLEAVPIPTRTPTPWRAVTTLIVGLLVLTLAAAAFTLGRSGGANLDAARAAGASAGANDGVRTGAVAGSFAGDVEGQLAGHQFAWQTAFDQARSRTLIAARRAALERRKTAQDAAAAAAAAAQPQFADNSSCSGYRDARGYWVCS